MTQPVEAPASASARRGVIGTSGPVDQRKVQAVESVPGRLRGPGVLVVVEDPDERAALSDMLAPLNYRVVEATSGEHARGCLTRQEFAVVVLDGRVPGGDSFETAAFIRSLENVTSTPIIFLTTIDRAEHEMTLGFAMGAVDFIVAPVLPAALRGKVALFADLFAKTQELVERAQRLRVAATRSSEALEFQLEMLDRLEQLSRAKSDFISKISHELRSPLTSVIGYIELLADGGPGEPSPEQARMYAIIQRNSRRLLDLIEDLLTMSRVEAGTFELHVSSFDLAEVVENVRETAAPLVAKSELELSVDLDGDLHVLGDKDQLERAILNLVSNSVKFTSAPGEVAITVRVEADELVVAVRDTGFGIPVEEQEHLFTRFFRTSRSQEQQIAGTGLGLFIVKQIVQLHGGSVEVVSSPEGSTFTLRVPVAGPPADPLALVRKG